MDNFASIRPEAAVRYVGEIAVWLPGEHNEFGRNTLKTISSPVHLIVRTQWVDQLAVGRQTMRISEPERYKLSFDSASFAVQCQQGTPKFSGIATSKKPKLYIVSVEGKPIYVGVTKQPLRNRLRYGWSANGENGYYGYTWRHQYREADIDIWCHEDAPDENPIRDIETIEAEVVFLIRSAGQWPVNQTEIHFHPSTSVHREIAAKIIGHYKLPPNDVERQIRRR